MAHAEATGSEIEETPVEGEAGVSERAIPPWREGKYRRPIRLNNTERQRFRAGMRFRLPSVCLSQAGQDGGMSLSGGQNAVGVQSGGGIKPTHGAAPRPEPLTGHNRPGGERPLDTHPMCGPNLLQVCRPRLGDSMSAWIATALAADIIALSAAITAVNAGPCTPASERNCLDIRGGIDFSSVPQISKQIADDERTDHKQQQPTGDSSAPAPYTGPIFGASPRPGRTPVVGYSWSLE